MLAMMRVNVVEMTTLIALINGDSDGDDNKVDCRGEDLSLVEIAASTIMRLGLETAVSMPSTEASPCC